MATRAQPVQILDANGNVISVLGAGGNVNINSIAGNAAQSEVDADGRPIGGSGWLPVYARLEGFDGTAWDRLRTAVLGANNASVGHLNVIAEMLRAGTSVSSLAAESNFNDGGSADLMLAVHSRLFSGAGYDRRRGITVIKDVNVAVTAGTPATVWTPTSGKKFRLMAWQLALSVAGNVIFFDSAASMFRQGAMPGGQAIPATELDNGFLSAAANNPLKVDVSASGTVTGFVAGVEE